MAPLGVRMLSEKFSRCTLQTYRRTMNRIDTSVPTSTVQQARQNVQNTFDIFDVAVLMLQELEDPVIKR